MIYDVAIIGGGPAGYTAAERAAANGLKTILFEKNALGGICLNEGCIPTKSLLYSAKVFETIKNASKYGVVANAEPTFDLSKVISRKQKIVRKLTAGIKQKLAAHEVTIVNGLASVNGENTEKEIEIVCNEETFVAKNIIISTGSETFIPPIKGLDQVDFWTSKEALENKEIPTSLVVIGGGVIGIEFASFFNSIGTKVTVVEMLPEILGAMDNELSAMLRTEYTKKGIDFHLSSKVIEVTPSQVIIEKEGEVLTIDVEKTLLSAGRVPSFLGLNIEVLNLKMNGRRLDLNQYMQTSNPSVYACGDSTGSWLLAHAAVREGELAVNHILGKDDEISYKAIPSVVYTNPEIACVGKTEQELVSQNISFKKLQLPMAYSGRFVAENELGNGVCKLLVDEKDVVVGCHILGNPASELIVIAGIAIEKRYTVEEFQKIVFPHPTVGEILHESLFA